MIKSFFGCLLFLMNGIFLSASLEIPIHSESAILINAETGAVIYEKNAHTPLYPASITKIATALYTLEQKGDKLQEMVTASRSAVASVTSRKREASNFSINPHWIEVGGSHIGIKAGEQLSLEALLYGLLLASGNDAANVIAEHVGGGSADRFINELNAYIEQLGCTHTHFVCAHGHHHPDHITTAYDMAIIARKAMQHPKFRDIVSTEKYRRPETNKQNPVTLVQTNKLIRKGSKFYYDKAIGIKTGHGSYAKDTLVAAAEFKGRTLIAVLLKAKERRYIFEDAVRLFDAAFAQPKLSLTIAEAGPQKTSLKLAEAHSPIETFTEVPLKYEYYQGENDDFQAWIVWNEGLQLPVKKGQQVGQLILGYPSGHVLSKVELFAAKDVKQSIWIRTKDWFRQSPTTVALVAFFSLCVVFFGGFLMLPKRR